MIRFLKTKPMGFDHLPDHYEWFELVKNSVYAHVGIEIVGEYASFHINVLEWNHNIAKVLRLDWEDLKSYCRLKGATKAVASNKTEDKLWVKFIKMFGFPEPKIIVISEQEL